MLFIAEGAIVTLKYSVISVIFGLVIGTLLALLKTSKYKSLRIAGDVYTSIFRGTPLLIQLMIIYYGLPNIGIKLGVFAAGVIAFSLNSGAYVSEIIRSGINSVDHGQFEAAKALGIPTRLTMKDIILPQAIRKILPSLINELINLLKESAIISILGEMDLMRRAQMVASESFIFFTPFITATICYYLLVVSFTYLARILEKRMEI
ncbi:MAG: amino acid ABC transporter permease [Rickettsiaceae bacterium]|nr:amino acid ABC transporter permease [Rickettsiaceae bacterium]